MVPYTQALCFGQLIRQEILCRSVRVSEDHVAAFSTVRQIHILRIRDYQKKADSHTQFVAVFPIELANGSASVYSLCCQAASPS